MNVSMQIKRPPVGGSFDSFSTILALSLDDVPVLQEYDAPLSVKVIVLQLLTWKHVLFSAVMQGTMTMDEFVARLNESVILAKAGLASDYWFLLEELNLLREDSVDD